MISVSGYWLRPEDIEKLNVSQTQRDIANRMLAMPSGYRYGSISELLFEPEIQRAYRQIGQRA